MLGYEELVAAGPAVDDVRRGGDALAALFYTGGTTGFPKGVMLSHANLLTSALGSMATGGFGSWERFLYAVPMFHLAGLGAFIGVGLAGGTQVIVPVFDPIAVLAAIEQHRVTDTLLIPIMIQLIVDHPQRAEHDLSSLQLLSYAGSPIALPLLDRARKALPGAGLTQGYGLTECGVISLLLPADHEDDSSHPDRRASGGRAAPHAEVRIVDSEDRELPRGQVGEIVVRGGSTMLGYWGKPEETAIALRGGWMHTGDAGRMDAHGYLSIVDRIRDMIVTGGENVYSAEVENAVATHPAVAKCAVIGVPDEQWGERVHAVVVCTQGTQASEQEIRAHTKTLIAGYKAPRTVEFVETLPVTPIGKVLKRELRAKVLDRH
jgi:acyl-CoA synthetase (AMP-forming)/AMP-acid ligase II